MITLILSAQSSSNYAHSDLLRHEFDQQGGTIGRSINNTWMLPDDHKHLSGQHARIEYIDGQYFITDISTNGVFINGDESPLGPNRMPLQNGDVLRMGWYDVTVTLPTTKVASAHIEEPNNAHPLADVPTCIVGASDTLIPPPKPTPNQTPEADFPDWEDDITPLPQKSSTHSSMPNASSTPSDDFDWDDDDWWQTDKASASTSTPTPLPSSANISTPAPVPVPTTTPDPTATHQPRANSSDLDQIDPDKLFDDDDWWNNNKDIQTNAQSQPNQRPISETLAQDLNDDRFEPQVVLPQQSMQESGTNKTHHQQTHQPISPISQHKPDADQASIDSDFTTHQPTSQNKPYTHQPSIDSDFANDLNNDLNFDETTHIHHDKVLGHLGATSSPLPANTPEINNQPNTQQAKPIPSNIKEQPIVHPQPRTPTQPTQQTETPARPTAEPIVQHAAPHQPVPNTSYKPVVEQTAEQQTINQAAIQAFIKGLGINDADVEQRISRDLDFEQVGYLFRHSVQGILDLLYSRADIKNEMRMDMTTIQPIENNPLKFAIHVNDALHDLLCKQNKNYLPPEQALNEAYDDIRAHQIAVISGIQAAIHELLARFEPEKLSERLQKRSTIAASIPGLRKAKLWALFEELHETIQQEAHNDFSRLFGAAFAEAYDQQIRVLRQNAKNKTSA